jgi:hypothetical protein
MVHRTQKPLTGFECRRRDLNPHERNAHYALNVARLPVPPLRLRAILTEVLPLSTILKLNDLKSSRMRFWGPFRPT